MTLGSAMVAALHTSLDVRVKVFATYLAQTPDFHAWDGLRPEEGIGGRSTDAQFSGELVSTQESFGFFGLRARKHPVTSVAAKLPLHLVVTGSCSCAARVVPFRLLPRPTFVNPARP